MRATNGLGGINGAYRYSFLQETYFRATERRLPYGFTTPNIGEHT